MKGPVGTAVRLWRASFTAPARAMPGLLDEFELVSLSLSIFEDEADADARTTRWRVELVFTEEPEIEALAAELERRCAPFGFSPGRPLLAPVPEADWLAATAMQAEPIQVGRFFVHGRAEANAVPEGSLPLQIEAGLAFGSGEHATTRACLEALSSIHRRPRRVLDLGCGSGILGIAAARLWAVPVLLVDNDPVAVRVAAENARLNGVDGRVRAALGDGWKASVLRRRGPYDLVLANLLADPLIEMAGKLARALAPGGRAILSGFVVRDVARVAAAHRRHQLRPVTLMEREPWAALVVRRWFRPDPDERRSFGGQRRARAPISAQR